MIASGIGLVKMVPDTCFNRTVAYEGLSVACAIARDHCLISAAYNESLRILHELGLGKEISATLTNLGHPCFTQADIGINLGVNLESVIADYSQATVIAGYS